MKKQWIQVVGLIAVASLTMWAQRGGGAGASGRGAGMGGGQGMPPAYSNAGANANSHANVPDSPKRTNSGPAASPHSGVSAANGAAIADRISANNGLSSKVGALLPAGMTLGTASAGFKNLGQFLAALHVSKNLNIPFTDLQKEMSSGKSLGQSIQTLSPTTAKDEVSTAVKNAEAQAKADENAAKRKSGSDSKS